MQHIQLAYGRTGLGVELAAADVIEPRFVAGLADEAGATTAAAAALAAAAFSSRQCSRKAVRSRGMTFSASAFLAQSRCLICSARRFSAASRYSGATFEGSTRPCARAGPASANEMSEMPMKDFKIASSK